MNHEICLSCETVKHCSQHGCIPLQPLKPCRSPYCECTPGTCSHPGCYDARSEPFEHPAPVQRATFPEGYALHELPADYTGKLWIEGQVRYLHQLTAAQPAQPPVDWREAVLDVIDECPGLTMDQDKWLTQRVKEIANLPRNKP